MTGIVIAVLLFCWCRGKVSDSPQGINFLTLPSSHLSLFPVFSGFETENKYRIRNTLGQDVYFAAESTYMYVRMWCCCVALLCLLCLNYLIM